MNDTNRSTLAYQSNIQPVDGSCLSDFNFLSKIRDPFALDNLNKQIRNMSTNYRLSDIQTEEYRKTSGHCSFAAKDDYPWGTIKQKDGKDIVVCKCINKECLHFTTCRPDFNEKELIVVEENKKYVQSLIEFSSETINDTCSSDKTAVGLIFKPIENISGRDQDDSTKNTPNSGDETAAGLTFNPIQKTSGNDQDTTQAKPERSGLKLPVYSTGINLNSSVPVVENERLQIGFEYFVETSQEVVIKSEAEDRILINAGPGTGKTWTLIEKLIYMCAEQQQDPEGILVLCFTRAAVEVIEQRLQAAAEADRIGYEWKKIEIRTFDSFATYMIDWVQREYPDLLPRNFNLSEQGYDPRIMTATKLLGKKDDMFSQFKHIIVDEVQDLVGVRAKFVLQILSILDNDCGFTILGDACQAIFDYQVKGDSSIMSSTEFYSELFNSHRGIHLYSFSENHRQLADLALITVPYRSAILTGNPQDRLNAIQSIRSEIGSSEINLQRISKGEISKFTKKGTLGILTRTNGQALKISTWLKNNDISHVLNRPETASYLNSWIAEVFMNYPNQTINEDLFSNAFIEQFPSTSRDLAKEYWLALISSLRESGKSRYDVEEILRGLLTNARNKLLFESVDITELITISNIHRAKGREFDNILVINDVLSLNDNNQNDELSEHKVCYVALTRPKKMLSSVNLKKQYIYTDKASYRRCYQSGLSRRSQSRYLSHIEIGQSGDLDKNTFARSDELQDYIKNKLFPDTRLRLLKCPENEAQYVMYRIVPEENENIVIGCTGKSFAESLKRGIQRIFENSSDINYRYYPNIFGEVYVDKLVTCISINGKRLPGAKIFGDFGVWIGFTVSGFAQIERELY